MKLLLTTAFLLIAILGMPQVHVRSYTRKDGTFVQSHDRTMPDATVTNDYSYPGNYNPNTNNNTPGNSARTYSSTSNQYLSSTATYSPPPAYTPPPAYNLPPILPQPSVRFLSNQSNIYDNTWVTDLKPARQIRTYHSVRKKRLRTVRYSNTTNSSALYKVTSYATHFYSLPNFSSKKRAYLTQVELFFGTKKSNGFVYVNFTNSLGKKTSGWIELFNVSAL